MKINTQDNGRIHKRELSVDDQVVSWLTLIDYQMRIGMSQVRMGGIAGVGTKEDQRMKGYSSKLLHDTNSYMLDEGYDVAFLFGIPDYYYKFGYSVCQAEPVFTFPVKEAPFIHVTSDIFQIRDASKPDVDSILDLYNKNNIERTQSIVRFTEYFDGISKGSSYGVPADTLVVTDASEEFIGYIALDKSEDKVNVVEVESSDRSAFPMMLKHLTDIAESRGCENITFYIPYDHPFIEYIRRFNCSLNTNYNRCQGAMMRIINQDSLFRKLQNVLIARLNESICYSGDKVELRFKTELGTTVLRIDDGVVYVESESSTGCLIEMPQSKLSQLIAGYRSIYDLMIDEDVTVEGNITYFINTLFPKTEPYTWRADHF
ncbi:MAG: GNAT family N-acetyltransferase [Armatimonadota bacterium]